MKKIIFLFSIISLSLLMNIDYVDAQTEEAKDNELGDNSQNTQTSKDTKAKQPERLSSEELKEMVGYQNEQTMGGVTYRTAPAELADATPETETTLPVDSTPQHETIEIGGSTFKMDNFPSFIITILIILIAVIIISIVAWTRSGEKIPNRLSGTLDYDFKNLNGDDFERFVGELYRRKGYDVIKTPKGPDYGVDLIAKRGSEKIVIQTKNWKNNVGSPDIQKTEGARSMHKATSAIVITSSNFTKSALKALENLPNVRGVGIDELKKEFARYFKK